MAPELAPVVLGLVLGTTAGFVAAAFYARTTFLLGATLCLHHLHVTRRTTQNCTPCCI